MHLIPIGPKPLKRFTPPPDYKGESEDDSAETDESEEEEENESNPNLIRASDKVEDEYLKQVSQKRSRSIILWKLWGL